MAEPEQEVQETPPKKSKLPLILGLVLALAGGGGGFYAVYSGMILGGTAEHANEAKMAEGKVTDIGEMPDVVFVPIEPLTISLGDGAGGAHLRFRGQLEVGSPYQAEVERLMPRVVDVLNSYLRALEPRDLVDSAALVRLRGQMLRRVQIVTGGDRVNDILIMEFVVN